jgi:predicted nucleic acid-binding protein
VAFVNKVLDGKTCEPVPFAKLADSVDGCARGSTRASLRRKRKLLTVYDAAYLELAVGGGLPLGSLDAELLTAAQLEGVGSL